MKQSLFIKVPVTAARMASLAQEAANKKTDLIALSAKKLNAGPVAKKAKPVAKRKSA
jgi:hypothetical protein